MAAEHKSFLCECQDASTVFFSKDISSATLLKLYEKLGRQARGRVAVKLSTGEAGNNNYLKPALIKELVQKVKGTIVECNTAYAGARNTTEAHRRLIKEHGFADIAEVDIMDSDGVLRLPVNGGNHLKENIVGSHLENYDFMMVLTHFKGHPMGGFGGALKNIAIGVASSDGKANIHTAGALQKACGWQSVEEGRFMKLSGPDHNAFIESMAEAAKSVSDYFGHGERMLYLSVMNNMSVDCDCVAHPAEVDMKDIGILASLNPVALDQACVDLVYEAPDGHSLIERIQSRNGEMILKHAQDIGFGERHYRLVCVD